MTSLEPRTADRRPLLALTGAATLGAAGVAVVAFIGSFHALAGFAVETGVATERNAWTWPVVIDVTILVATASLVARGLRGREARYPVGVTFAFVAISVLVNAAHALDPLTDGPRAMAAMSLAALLPIALAVCVHLVVLELHDLLNAVTAASSPAPAPADAPSAVSAPARPDLTADVAADGRADAAVTAGAGLAVAGGLDEVAAVVTGHLAAGGQVTDAELTAAVAGQLAVSERTARRRLEPYRNGPADRPPGAPAALSLVPYDNATRRP